MNSVLIKVAYFLEQPYSLTKPSLLCPRLSAWPSFHASRWFGLITKSINQPKNEFPHFMLTDEWRRQRDDKIGQLPPSDVLMWTFSGECLVFGERLWTSACRWPTHCIPDRPFCLDWTRNGAIPASWLSRATWNCVSLKQHPQKILCASQCSFSISAGTGPWTSGRTFIMLPRNKLFIVWLFKV